MTNDLNTHLPILLIVDEENSEDFQKVSRWLPGAALITYEASDVLDAIEEMSDFTVRTCPDVIVLKVSSFSQEYQSILRFLHCNPISADDPRILTFSDDSSYPHVVHDLPGFKVEFEKMRGPGTPSARARSM